MNILSSPVLSRRILSVACLCVVAFAATPVRLHAAAAAAETGARLLQAQLPTGASIQQTPCEPLARAVGRATLAHRADAPAILSAALTGGTAKKHPCACVTRIFRVAVAAAPAQASTLLETASALCPDCADALLATLKTIDAKNVVDARDNPAAPDMTESTPMVRGFADDPTPATDLSERDLTGLGFGNGFGPGFPGSPGFIGSPASGGIALPLPGAETPVVNG